MKSTQDEMNLKNYLVALLHCSIYACVMSQMFLFYFIFYGGALVFLGGAGAPASPSLAPPMPKGILG